MSEVVRVDVQVDGLRRLQRELKAAGADLADLKDANAKAAGIVTDDAGRRAPRRTGRLAGSGRPARAAGRATVMFGSAAVPYAGPVHYGWPSRGIAAHPFLTDAATDTQPEWLDAYHDELQQIADRVGGTY